MRKSMIMAKKGGKYSIPLLVGALLAFILQLIFAPDDAIEYAKTIDFAEIATGVLDSGDQGEVRAIVIDSDGQTIRNTSELVLMGGLDFTGKAGDMIVLQYKDGQWVEIGRHLVEEE